MGARVSDRLATGFFRYLLPSALTWKVKTDEKVVFLTFDDGPVPGLTGEILEILRAFDAKATFFCVGENVVRYPELFGEILAAAHAVGNHTHRHLKGWDAQLREYIEDVTEASGYIPSRLFRPPYGLIKWRQAKALSKTYRVVMWSVLTRDFDPAVSPEECLQIARKGIEPGAIIVFHDNPKARDKVLYALPKLLEYLKEEGFEFRVLSSEF